MIIHTYMLIGATQNYDVALEQWWIFVLRRHESTLMVEAERDMHNALFSNNMLQANAYTHRCSIFVFKCCANVLRIWEYATYACAWLENNTFHIFSLTALENMKKQKFRPALLHLSPDLSHHLHST